VAVKIKLKRLGKIRAPYYRIVVADARTKRDGRAIEEIGKYHPKAEPSFIEVDSERAQHWLSVGAQPTDPVRKILEITGDWQKFKGLPGTEGTLKTAAPKEDRKEIFAAAVKETLQDGAAAPKGKARSASGKDAETAPKGGRQAAKDSAPGRTDRPARGKAGDQPARAQSGESGEGAKAPASDTRARARSGDAKGSGARGGSPKDDSPKDGSPKDGSPKDGSPKDGSPKDGSPKDGSPKDGAPKDGAATGAAATDETAEGAATADDAADAQAPAEASAAAQSAVETADSESASGD
jgi:small subunit ribosomal protein S16